MIGVLVMKELSANPTKWLNILFITNCFSVLDHSVGLAPKRLNKIKT